MDNTNIDQAAESGRAKAWSAPKRFAFLFWFIYLVLYIFPAPIGYVPVVGAEVNRAWTEAKRAVVVPVGRKVFGVDITIFPGGSGDTTYNYVEVFVFAVVALIGAAVWTVADRRLSYRRWLNEGLRVYVRYTLGLTLFGYGIVKIIQSQFPKPDAYRLTTEFGDLSPMGLLWAFMGYSYGYNLFAGLAEAGAGLLLFYRRTTLLGSIVGAGVMSNVVALNFFFDVPVKLFSAHLLLQCFFLMAPDFGRLMNLLVLNRPVAPTMRLSAFTTPWLHWTWFGIKTAALLGVVTLGAIGAVQGYRTFGGGAKGLPISGLYNVETFTADGQERPALLTDGERWRDVVIGKLSPMDGLGAFRVRTMAGERLWYRFRYDEAAGRLTLISVQQGPGRVPGSTPGAGGEVDKPAEHEVTLTEAEHGVRVLEGTVEGRALRIVLRERPLEDFLLVNRGFRWINEYPFNR